LIVAFITSCLPIADNVYAASPKTKSNNEIVDRPNPDTFVKAKSALLIDIDSDEILWEVDSRKELPIASTTKIMTAILAIENGDLNDTVPIGKNVVKAGLQGGIQLAPGEKLLLKDLLFALMLNSANDAAVAIADYIGGSVEDFVYEMNNKAIKLGALNTNFTNPHGLDEKSHFSTANDLAIMTRYGLRNKVFADIVSTESKIIKRDSKKRINIVSNRNELLHSYYGSKGVKTGHTNSAGYCLVSAAKRDGVYLLSVVLGAKTQKSVFKQSGQLLDYGFSLYSNKELLKRGKVYKNIKSKYGEEISLTSDVGFRLTTRNASKVRLVTWSDDNIELPVRTGDHIGKIAVLIDDRVVTTANLVARTSTAKPTFRHILYHYVASIYDYLI
jgi:serine-type D-Ala-D-Ala carboxypeptidase (penicillin-binding protein 5/6)